MQKNDMKENCRYELFGWRNLEGSGPMLIHTGENVDKPLAGDVIADENEDDCKGLDNKCKEVIHVQVSAQLSTFTAIAIEGK